MKKSMLVLLTVILTMLFLTGCPAPSTSPLPDIVVTLGPDESPNANTSAVDNGDGSWTITFNTQYAWYQRSIPSAPQDLTGYTKMTIVFSNSFASGTHGIKLDLLDDTYTSIFTSSDSNWRDLTNGATAESITWNLTSGLVAAGLSSVQAVVLQNNTSGDAITIHSITFSE